MRQSLRYERLRETTASIRRDPRGHPLRRELLGVELLPYQLDGIAFSVEVGRAILADDMGLGKTIQGIGIAELLARLEGIERVLVVSPASLKSQWLAEIRRCTGPGCAGGARHDGGADEPVPGRLLLHHLQLRAGAARHPGHRAGPVGPHHPRRGTADQELGGEDGPGHQGPALALRPGALGHAAGEPARRAVLGGAVHRRPAARTRFRLLPPASGRDEKGRVLGYKNLDELRGAWGPSSSAERAPSVLRELPPRTHRDRAHRPLPGTARHPRRPQEDGDDPLLAKRYISEMDLLRLQKALLMCRMAADSTFLVDKQPPGHSTKLAELDALLEKPAAEQDRKIILFSEWTTMLDLIEPLVEKRDTGSSGWTARCRRPRGRRWSIDSSAILGARSSWRRTRAPRD